MNVVWTMDEIHAMPEFGGDVGWFYGLIWYERRLWFGEVFPGSGFAACWPQANAKNWWWAFRDVFATPGMKSCVPVAEPPPAETQP